MKRVVRAVAAMLAAGIMAFGISANGYAYSPQIEPFPIGIFWPPGPAETTSARYAEINEMNANFVVGGNGVSTLATNDQALMHASNNGIRLLVDDVRLMWRSQLIEQKATGFGLNVSSSSALGQTFKTPAGTGWGLNTVKLYVDKTNWPASTTLTLKLYDSPAKATLLASSSINGSANTYYPEFQFHTVVQSDKSYYVELTSSSPTPVGWVVTSSSDVYPGGQAYMNGTVQNLDFWFEMNVSQRAYNDGNRPSNADIDAIANYYKNKSGLQGYHVTDEPSALQMTRILETTRRIRMNDPNHTAFVNLFPTYANANQLGLDQLTGLYVSSAAPIGQTFKTKPGLTKIDTVQWWIDKNTWGAGEALTLKLWDSSAKQTLIAQSTLTTPPTEWPQFALNATISGNTSYYMELTHNGGGDNSVGWVVRSNTGDDWYPDGNGSINGAAFNGDFWFTINQSIQGGTYEDYVYRWMYTNPDVLVFDHYPFMASGQIRSDYYTNLEVIRRQALLGNADFWSYIQSVGISGVWKTPTQSEMNYQIYTNLAYGAKGYIYFTYWTPASSGGESFANGLILPDGTKNASYTWAQSINAKVKQWGPVLNSLRSEAVYHTGSSLPSSVTALPAGFFWQLDQTSLPSVIGYFKNASGRKYVMVVNRDTVNARTLSFTLATKPSSVKEISSVNGAEIDTNYNASTGTLSSSFAAGEGKLFVLPSGY
ncbi:hypothetical protein [Paenibacillus mendelii]|uniref:Glycoside hydrolase family 42 N-terminal domain-containing protein n=1 Tax=Paenibacillus mendelii TaxID=206163 RepID=A0ABV6J6K2_9BACL|nr:hypothetical protein [Paenibacillus mendelii]MCQ6562014.1 hypothetical protein [Paenibacillus mendelii]